jgi:hypothetical protein
VRRIGIFVFASYGVLFAASTPLLYNSLAEPLQKSTVSIEKLSQKPIMEPNKQILRSFLNRMETTLILGKELSDSKHADDKRMSAYLQDLCELSRTKESIDLLYRKSLDAAIAKAA